MAHFYRFETVSIPITIEPAEALQDAKTIMISLKQGTLQIDKDQTELGIDTDTGQINLYLTQEETAQFVANSPVQVQLNIYYEDTERDTSAIAQISVNENLYKKVMA